MGCKHWREYDDERSIYEYCKGKQARCGCGGENAQCDYPGYFNLEDDGIKALRQKDSINRTIAQGFPLLMVCMVCWVLLLSGCASSVERFKMYRNQSTLEEFLMRGEEMKSHTSRKVVGEYIREDGKVEISRRWEDTNG